jgi:hypothetical protein
MSSRSLFAPLNEDLLTRTRGTDNPLGMASTISTNAQHFTAHFPRVPGRHQTCVKAVYTAVDATAACSAFDELTGQWGSGTGSDPIVEPDRDGRARRTMQWHSH